MYICYMHKVISDIVVVNVYGKKEQSAGFLRKLVYTESYCFVYIVFCIFARWQALMGSCEPSILLSTFN